MRGESSLTTQWEVRFPAVISATSYRWIKPKLNTTQHAFGPNSSSTAPARSYETFNFSPTSGQIKLAEASLWPPWIRSYKERRLNCCMSLIAEASAAPELDLYWWLWLSGNTSLLFSCLQQFHPCFLHPFSTSNILISTCSSEFTACNICNWTVCCSALIRLCYL